MRPPLDNIVVLQCAHDLAPEPDLLRLVVLSQRCKVPIDQVDLFPGQAKASPLQFLLLSLQLTNNTSPLLPQYPSTLHRQLFPPHNLTLGYRSGLLHDIGDVDDIPDALDAVDPGQKVGNMRHNPVVLDDRGLLDPLLHFGDSTAHIGEKRHHVCIVKVIQIFYLHQYQIGAMEANLDIVNQFISIIAGEENVGDRLQSQWEYLHKLLRTQPVAYDRIDAYLNILKHQDQPKKRSGVSSGIRSSGKGSHCRTAHPESRKYRALIEGTARLIDSNDDRLSALTKQLCL